jgi:PKD repeat protein
MWSQDRDGRGVRLPALVRRGAPLLAAVLLLLYVAGGLEHMRSRPAPQAPPAPVKLAGLEVEILPRPSPVRSLPQEAGPAPDSHTVRKGDTLFGVSETYDLPLYHLLLWNRINDPTKIQPGDLIRLSRPIGDFLKGSPPAEPTIWADVTTGNPPLAVRFTCDSQLQEGSFLWDLGDWHFSYERSPVYTFEEPGLFTVKLRTYGNTGGEIPSNSLTVRVLPRRYRDVNRSYITLSGPDEVLDLGSLFAQGSSEADAAGGMRVVQKPRIFENTGDDLYVAARGGYSRLTVQTGQIGHKVYTFVSPIPSRHAWEPDYDWYKTQFGTGITGNCGPATVAMASYWSSGIDTSVASIRSEIGMPHANGAIAFAHMEKPLDNRGVPHSLRRVGSPEDLRDVIDRDGICIVLIDTSRIEHVGGDPRSNLIGRYYWESTGHYLVVKGYTLDGRYFIVYDPIPSDWRSNGLRYPDGASMLGRNRYYPASQLLRSLKQPLALEIMRPQAR